MIRLYSISKLRKASTIYWIISGIGFQGPPVPSIALLHHNGPYNGHQNTGRYHFQDDTIGLFPHFNKMKLMTCKRITPLEVTMRVNLQPLEWDSLIVLYNPPRISRGDATILLITQNLDMKYIDANWIDLKQTS